MPDTSPASTTSTRRTLAYLLPSILLIGFLVLYLFRDSWMLGLVQGYPDHIAAASSFNRALQLGLWITATWTFLAMVRIFIFQGILERRRGQKLPDLLTNLFRLGVISIVLMLVATSVFQVSELTIALIVGGLAAVIAIFFRDALAELFAGLSINLDQGIDIGYRIALPDGTEGVVQEMNWRSVALLTSEGSTAIVPNSLLAGGVVKNLNVLGDKQAVSFELTLDFSLPVERGIRVLSAALISACQQSGIATQPAPRAYASGPGSFGIIYKLEFYFHRDLIDEGEARSEVMRQVMKHLMGTGLTIALPKQNVFVGEVRMMAKSWERAYDREALIGNIDLFESLEQHELKQLADAIVIHHVKAGQDVMREGDTSTSMYGLAEGVLEVTVDNNGRSQMVATIDPGSFFGEMSMLADEPRSATVTAIVDSMVFELERESFGPVLSARTELAESISRLIAERQLANSELLANASSTERDEAISDASTNLLGRIRSVFSLFRQED